MARRDTGFDPTKLAACIVKGAAENDPVRLHGAIDAALQLHAPRAASDIFAPALKDAGRLYGPACAGAIATAVRRHLDARRKTSGAEAGLPQTVARQRPRGRRNGSHTRGDKPT
jgi:hypothetical protein